MYVRREYPEQSWSISRLNAFKQCKRKFYYITYGHWNGWEINSAKSAKRVYYLKNLEDLFTLSGSYLHDLIKSILSGKGLAADIMFQEVMSKLNNACYQSKRNVKEWKENPKAYTILHEYYYDGKIPDDLVNEIKERTNLCCTNLFKSRSFQELTEDPVEIIELDEKESYNHFKYNDVKVFCTLDVLYKNNDEVVLVDWKTGQPNDERHRLQMLVYVQYIIEKYKYDVEKIRCVDEYLLTGERYTNIFDRNDLYETIKYIDSSILDMSAYAEDIHLNKSKDISKFPASPCNLCASCNFIEICREQNII